MRIVSGPLWITPELSSDGVADTLLGQEVR